ncbi:hypothetical protein HD806DRAFT_547035 [Xylariaceae sp. AK1471]|nr:hypothetical protein HD806DRAFT_547035 [Xylariaceae sp. AK1471]
MPYKLHHWDDDSDSSDPGWPRRYVTYDYHTECSACHEPNGLLRVLQHLFGGPATRCRHHRSRGDGGWGGGVRGFIRRKGCKNKNHYALAFHPGIDISSYPDRLKLDLRPLNNNNNNVRTRLPEKCHGRTPRGDRPSHTLLRYYPDQNSNSNGQCSPHSPPYPVSEEGEEEDSPLVGIIRVDPRSHQRHNHEHKQKFELRRHGHRCQGRRKDYHRSLMRRNEGKKVKGKQKTMKMGRREDRDRHRHQHRHKRGDKRIHDPWRRSSTDYVQPFVVDAVPSSTSSSSSSSRTGRTGPESGNGRSRGNEASPEGSGRGRGRDPETEIVIIDDEV